MLSQRFLLPRWTAFCRIKDKLGEMETMGRGGSAIVPAEQNGGDFDSSVVIFWVCWLAQALV
jgi:hypothetical protein